MARHKVPQTISEAIQVVSFLLESEADVLDKASPDMLASEKSQMTIGGPVTMAVMLRAIAVWLRKLDEELKML